MMKSCILFLGLLLCSGCATSEQPSQSISVLIVDGQNNHSIWPKSTALMRDFFEHQGQFKVKIYRTLYTWQGGEGLKLYGLDDGKFYQDLANPKTDPSFKPNFADFDVVVSNFGWRAAPWPKETQLAFEQYMKNGGGFVSIHAANNAFPDWPEYNRMIGLGGWGGRNQKDGPYVYFDQNGEEKRDYRSGAGGGHGYQHRFVIQPRALTHPIMTPFSKPWLHSKDELYNRLRGPAENLTVLATAFDDKKHNGFGRHEPVVMTISYFEGRVFHTTLGHGEEAFRDDNFIKLMILGVKWAAGKAL